MPFPGTPLQVPDFNKQEVEGIAVDAVKKEIASGNIPTGTKLYRHQFTFSQSDAYPSKAQKICIVSLSKTPITMSNIREEVFGGSSSTLNKNIISILDDDQSNTTFSWLVGIKRRSNAVSALIAKYSSDEETTPSSFSPVVYSYMWGGDTVIEL